MIPAIPARSTKKSVATMGLDEREANTNAGLARKTMNSVMDSREIFFQRAKTKPIPINVKTGMTGDRALKSITARTEWERLAV